MAYAGYHFNHTKGESPLNHDKGYENTFPGFVLRRSMDEEEYPGFSLNKKKDSGVYPGFDLRKKFDEENELQPVNNDDSTGFSVSGDSSEPYNIRNTSIRLYSDIRRQVSDELLQQLVKKAQKNGWTTLYTYDPTGKYPNIDMAVRINAVIESMGLSDQIKSCTEAGEYEKFPTIDSVIEHNRSKGALEWWGQAVRPPLGLPRII
jgi:hypothetical protein